MDLFVGTVHYEDFISVSECFFDDAPRPKLQHRSIPVNAGFMSQLGLFVSSSKSEVSPSLAHSLFSKRGASLFGVKHNALSDHCSQWDDQNLLKIPNLTGYDSSSDLEHFDSDSEDSASDTGSPSIGQSR